MIDEIHFTVPGEPVPQGRPRFSTRGGFARAIDPEKSKAYKATVAIYAKAAMRGKGPFTGGVAVAIDFYHGIPKRFTKGKRLAAEYGMIPKTTRSDLDNQCKAVTDGMQGITWRDDAQIVSLTATKRYGKTPRAVVRVWPKELFDD